MPHKGNELGNLITPLAPLPFRQHFSHSTNPTPLMQSPSLFHHHMGTNEISQWPLLFVSQKSCDRLASSSSSGRISTRLGPFWIPPYVQPSSIRTADRFTFPAPPLKPCLGGILGTCSSFRYLRDAGFGNCPDGACEPQQTYPDLQPLYGAARSYLEIPQRINLLNTRVQVSSITGLEVPTQHPTPNRSVS